MRLSVTTATTANADRELLSNRVVVARHIPTNCRKVKVWPSSRMMRMFFFIFFNSFRPCISKNRRFPPFLSSRSYYIAMTLRPMGPVRRLVVRNSLYLKGCESVMPL
jgi:hypothetical protein